MIDYSEWWRRGPQPKPRTDLPSYLRAGRRARWDWMEVILHCLPYLLLMTVVITLSIYLSHTA